MRKFLVKATIVLVGLLIGLAAAEVALRIYYRAYEDRTEYRKNKEGFRDVEHSVAKPPGTIRVAFQGDSFTYGQGVDFREIFSTRVGKILARKIPDHKIEVLNFGIPALDVFGDLNNIRKKVMKYDPDEIVFSYVLNDFSDPRMDLKFISCLRREIERYKVFRRFEKYSKLAYFVDWILYQLLSDARHIHLQWLRDSFDPARNPRYHEMKNALEEIIRIVSSKSSVVVFFPYLVAAKEENVDFYNCAKHLVEGLCKKYKCPFLEVLPLLKSRPYYRWWVSADDHHPNAAAHKLIAEAIAKKLLEFPN
jgi:hypothetical protein